MTAAAAQAPEAFRRRLIDAVRKWQRKMAPFARRRKRLRKTARLTAVGLGRLRLVCMNAEVFSRMAPRLRALTGRKVYVVGYTDGVFGYLPTAAAFAEGGYEPDQSFIFYGSMPLKPEAFEQVARRAARLVASGR
jgi:hypothetical protein